MLWQVVAAASSWGGRQPAERSGMDRNDEAAKMTGHGSSEHIADAVPLHGDSDGATPTRCVRLSRVRSCGKRGR